MRNYESLRSNNPRLYNFTLLFDGCGPNHDELKYDIIRLVVDEQFNDDSYYNIDEHI